MSIATAIQNAQQKVANAYTAVNAKGGTLPATQDLSNLPTAIDSISTGDVWHNWKTDVTVNSSNTSQYNSKPSVVYGNGVYLMLPVTVSGASSIYYTSTDGVNFTSRTFPGNVQSVTFGHGLFIAAYVEGTIYSSSDGETWTTVTSSATFGGNYVICNFVNDKFYICPSTYAQGVAYSDDGINWTYDSSAAVYGHLLYCNGLYVRHPDSGSTWVYTSTDLTNWTGVNVYDKVGTLTGISCGNGVFVVQKANDTSILYTTTDFSTFTSHQIENNGRIDFGNGLFVAPQTTATSGSVGSIAYSSDGENWTTASITQSHLYNNDSAGPIWFAGDYFFAVGSNGVSMCRVQFAQSECYTLDATPTTSTQVYEIPKKTSALTITSVGTGTITLSDSKVYNRNSAGDVQSPVLGTKTIDTNGTYTAASDYLDGFSGVTVDVPVPPTKKYQLLDRIKDDSNNEIGTVSGFFTDANNVEYAVVCLDAQYRLASGVWSTATSQLVSNLPTYTNAQIYSSKETATFNTQCIINSTNSSTTCNHCRAQTFIIDSTTYYGQLPNVVELEDIFKNITAINAADTSASSYPSLIVSVDVHVWTSNQYDLSYAWQYNQYYGCIMGFDKSKAGAGFVIPVLEIPNS